MRINVTGNAGAGKSTLAKRLAQDLGLPLVEMDRIVWDSGWREAPKDEQQRRLTPLLEGNSWVVDGVSRKVRDLADVIIFLDYPAHICAWRCARRAIMQGFGTREGLPPDCPEWKIIPRLLRIIYNFPSSARKTILEDIEKRNRDDLVLRSRRETDELFDMMLKENNYQRLIARL